MPVCIHISLGLFVYEGRFCTHNSDPTPGFESSRGDERLWEDAKEWELPTSQLRRDDACGARRKRKDADAVRRALVRKLRLARVRMRVFVDRWRKRLTHRQDEAGEVCI